MSAGNLNDTKRNLLSLQKTCQITDICLFLQTVPTSIILLIILCEMLHKCKKKNDFSTKMSLGTPECISTKREEKKENRCRDFIAYMPMLPLPLPQNRSLITETFLFALCIKVFLQVTKAVQGLWQYCNSNNIITICFQLAGNDSVVLFLFYLSH